MLKRALQGMIMISILMVAGTVMAIDIVALDKVSVLMPKSRVLSILGPPHEVGMLRAGLQGEIYRLANMGPMVGTGCIYDNKEILKGQAFIFAGGFGRDSADQMKKMGFTVVEEKGGSFRLLGKDDDTGQPLLLYIFEEDGMTTIMAFEKGFYDETVK